MRLGSAAWVVSVLMLVGCGGGDGTEAPAGGAGASPPAAAREEGPAGPSGSASVSGRVLFTGTPPAPQRVQMSADPKCAQQHEGGTLQRQSVEVKDGGLADAVVYVKGIEGSYPAPSEAKVLDQDGCQYQPDVLALQAGQPLTIRNSDPTMHNVNARPKDNQRFNMAQPTEGMETTKTFDKAELMIPVGCDVHPWMKAHVSVFAHPFFAVTDDSGGFTITGLPAGEYEVEAAHPRLGKQAGKVTLQDGQEAKLELTFSAPAG